MLGHPAHCVTVPTPTYPLQAHQQSVCSISANQIHVDAWTLLLALLLWALVSHKLFYFLLFFSKCFISGTTNSSGVAHCVCGASYQGDHCESCLPNLINYPSCNSNTVQNHF
jgi:hypothetical protein